MSAYSLGQSKGMDNSKRENGRVSEEGTLIVYERVGGGGGGGGGGGVMRT